MLFSYISIFTSLPGKEQLLELLYLFASNINQLKLILLGIFRPFYLLVSIPKNIYGSLILFTVLFFADFHVDARNLVVKRVFKIGR